VCTFDTYILIAAISASGFIYLHLICSCMGRKCSLIHTCSHCPQLQLQHLPIGASQVQRPKLESLCLSSQHSSCQTSTCCNCAEKEKKNKLGSENMSEKWKGKCVFLVKSCKKILAEKIENGKVTIIFRYFFLRNLKGNSIL